MNSSEDFEPWPRLVKGKTRSCCRASVIVPARNEEASLAATLDALAAQMDIHGSPLSRESFEVLLLLNNCTDQSVAVARSWKRDHADFELHIIEKTLQGAQAHVGTARRMLMDTAWRRLKRRTEDSADTCGILSTDSDTLVAPDWIARNLLALDNGADAVGGVIRLKPGELEKLPSGVRRAYLRDRAYQVLVAELENLLDPQDGDGCPRHLEHFGASLACTPEAYAKAGGMPPVKPLEDIAFVNALRRQGARLRHDPSVVVYTSARFDGRAEVGLSFQLREWQKLTHAQDHTVLSANWLIHRFQMLALLRAVYREWPIDTTVFIGKRLDISFWEQIESARGRCSTLEEFLIEIDCDQFIEKTFKGSREGFISKVNQDLKKAIAFHQKRNE